MSHCTLHSKPLTSDPSVCASPSLVACVRASAPSLCCACCGVASVGGGRRLCGLCLLLALGGGHTHDSCLGHGHDVLGGTKTQSMRTWSGVWRPLEGPLSMADRLALGHRGESEVHVEAREGCISTNCCGTRLVDLGKGCEIEVKIPTDPESDTWAPGPGVTIRERWGWKPLLRTLTSGIWVLPGALQGLGFEEALASAASWVGRGTYRTAWAVPPMSGCQCSYSYGHGPAIGPHTGQQTFWMLSKCGGLSHP